jgi:DNA polymerase I
MTQTETDLYSDFKRSLTLFDLPMTAIDTETSTSEHKDDDRDIRDGSGYANGLSVASRVPGLPVFSYYLPFRHINSGGDYGDNLDRDCLYELKQRIENYDGYLIFHNAKFDLVSLETLGIKYTGKFFCTMELAHLIHEERPFSKSLDAVGKHYTGDVKVKSEMFQKALKHYGWKHLPPNIIREYGMGDADLTYRVMEKLLPLIDDDLMKYWHEQKMPFYKVIIAMERRGVRVDTALCERMINHGEICMDEIVEILQLNPGSPKDLSTLLIDKLGLPVVKRSQKTQKPSFDKEAMKDYETMLELRDDPTARYILEYRGWQKSVSSNYRPYIELLSVDGRLRPNYKLHGTKTGRMSCEKPNLQQIPRVSNKPWNGEMKSAFIPAPGYRLWEADYGQLELRLATAYANERGLKAVFEEDRDVFTEMSEQLGMARHDTKTLTYTIQYGGGIRRLTTVFGIQPARAQEIRENFYQTYPGFRAVSNLAQRKAAAKGKLQLWSGRYRHFSYPKDEAHKAFNSVIQGGAADIVERTMIRLFNEVDNEEECRMLLQVHDSVVFEIKEGLEDKYRELIVKTMEDIKPDFGVKFKVDFHEWGH